MFVYLSLLTGTPFPIEGDKLTDLLFTLKMTMKKYVQNIFYSFNYVYVHEAWQAWAQIRYSNCG